MTTAYQNMENTASQLSQSPLKKISLSNPYIKVCTERGAQSIPVTTDGNNTIFLPLAYYDKALKLEAYSKYVKTFSIIDGIFGIIGLFFAEYIYLLSLFASYCGYYGSKKFKKSYLSPYIIYLGLVTISRFIYPVALEYYLESQPQPSDINLPNIYFVSILFGILELGIFFFVIKLRRLIPEDNFEHNQLYSPPIF